MNELDKKKARDLAVAAKELQEQIKGSGDAFEKLLEGIQKIPKQMQMMVDHIVVLQREFPMPEEGWKSFIEDIEHTNEKHGLNLRIKPELFK